MEYDNLPQFGTAFQDKLMINPTISEVQANIAALSEITAAK